MVFQFNHKIHPKIFRIKKKKNGKTLSDRQKLDPSKNFPQNGSFLDRVLCHQIFLKKFQIIKNFNFKPQIISHCPKILYLMKNNVRKYVKCSHHCRVLRIYTRVHVSNLNKTLFLVITVVINKELLQEVSYILHYYK